MSRAEPARTQEVAKLIRSSIIETRLHEAFGAPLSTFSYRLIARPLRPVLYLCSTLLHSWGPPLCIALLYRYLYLYDNAKRPERKMEVENWLFTGATVNEPAVDK